MRYALLVAAIAVEVTATIATRYSDGFTRPLPTLIAVLGVVAPTIFCRLCSVVEWQ